MANKSKKPGAKTGEAVAQKRPSGINLEWMWGLLLVFAVIAAYQPVWSAGFIWDDDSVVTNNPVIIGPLGLKEIWTTSAADVCPLTLSTFWLENQLWGREPLPYHVVNVLLQALCAVLLWRVLLRLRIPGAWLGAALWALHPVMVESVAWVSEMKNTESGIFFLLSILFFLKGFDVGEKGRWSYILTLLFAALAMASKSSTVILPIILCLCAWWMERRWQGRVLLKTAPVFLMSIAAGLASMWTQQLQGASDPQWSRSWPERLVDAGDAVWFYLGKLVWPYPLLTLYPRGHTDAGLWLSYLPLVAVIGVLALLWFARDSWGRPWLFAYAYFLVALLPTLGLLENYIFRYSVVFDHFQYLAAMGPLALAGAGFTRMAEVFVPSRAGVQSVLGAGVLLLLGTLSWNQTSVYENKVTLWNHTLTGNPGSEVANNNLGIAAFQEGRLDEAMKYFQKTLEINPQFPEAQFNVGLLLSQGGHTDEAIAHYKKAVEYYPSYFDAQRNLGVLLNQVGRVDEAIASFQTALQMDPDSAEIHGDLGAVYAEKGQLDAAISQLQEALKIDPNNANAHSNLGNALSQKGLVDDALAQFVTALNLDPNIAQTHNNFGSALLQKGRTDEAIAQFEAALQIMPGYVNAQRNLEKAQSMTRPKPAQK